MRGSKKMVSVNHVPLRMLPVKPAMLVVGVVLGTSVLGACSQVPDAVNPAEWYRGTVDFFAGESSKDQSQAEKNKKEGGLGADRGKAPPGSNQAFPNLASVDQQARARDNKGGGLSADTERPKYAPAISRQGSAVTTLRDRPKPAPRPAHVPVPAGAAQPAPPAMPKPVVAQAPVPAKTYGQPPAQPEMARPGPAPKLASTEMTADQRAIEERLARQLADIRSRAADGGSAPALAGVSAAPSADGELATLVISSDGIISGEGQITPMEISSASAPAAPTAATAASRFESGQAGTSAPGEAVRVATILFKNGSARLQSNDTRILGAVVRLQRKQGGCIHIVGHASSRTRNLTPVKHKMANFKISVDRADKVAAALMRLGISKKDIQIAAVSDADPAYYEFMPSGEAGNRRTEVYLTR